MMEISVTLLSDGSSDKRLLPVIIWLFHQHRPDLAIQSIWADLRVLRNPPQTLAGKITKSLELYPCDLLFIHRDSENDTPENRTQEIIAVVESVSEIVSALPVICVVPVRMQEAWLLFDEGAIRKAAGNPNGDAVLQLPHLPLVESLPDPKNLLYDLLREASELRGRRLKKFSVSKSAHLVAEYIEDYSPLRTLPAFNALEAELTNFVGQLQMNTQ
jgi:hypothetical protein